MAIVKDGHLCYSPLLLLFLYMKILFIGQKGIPAKHENDIVEYRTQTLAHTLSRAGHQVYVACKKSYRKPFLRNVNGIQCIYSGFSNHSLISKLLDIVSTIYIAWKLNPDVVHFQSWSSAAAVRIVALLRPKTTFIWTISHIPNNAFITQCIALQARAAFDAISTPYRDLQYKLLVEYGIRAQYIPDGYTRPVLVDIAPKHWSIRKNQYIFSTATTKLEAQSILNAYKALKSRRKLIFCTTDPSLLHLARRNKNIICLNPVFGRSLSSLVRQASVVIALEPIVPSSLLLQAMDAERPIIISTHPFHEEIVGTGAYIVPSQTQAGLEYALRLALAQKVNTTASKRAKAHFTWPRVVEEYMILYSYPYIQRVPLDSAVQRPQELSL